MKLTHARAHTGGERARINCFSLELLQAHLFYIFQLYIDIFLCASYRRRFFFERCFAAFTIK